MARFNNTKATNGSNDTECDLKEDFKYILLPVSYSLVFVIGLGLNITAMYFILFRTKHWKPNTIYMINLNVCDTLYILTLPFLIYYYADENDWPFGEFMCKLIRFLFYTNLYGSILFLSCISVHRFIGVCHPVQSLSLLNAQYARLVSVGIWVIILILQAPILYFSRTTHKKDIDVCHDTTSEDLYDNFAVYSLVVMALLFGVPFVVVLFCNGMMVKRLTEGPTSKRSKQKSVKMIIMVLLTFILCFLPFHVNRSVHYTLRYIDDVSCDTIRLSNITYQATRPLLSMNSCIDPILYFMAGQGFKNNSRKSNQTSERSISTV